MDTKELQSKVEEIEQNIGKQLKELIDNAPEVRDVQIYLGKSLYTIGGINDFSVDIKLII